jgi:Family of unknown function (DUF6188)
MYQINSRFDLQRFAGRVLRQVSFAKFQVALSFSEGILIDIECNYTCSGIELNCLNLPVEIERAQALIAALESTVLAVKTLNDADLLIKFDNGLILSVETDPNYESYHLIADGKTITI